MIFKGIKKNKQSDEINSADSTDNESRELTSENIKSILGESTDLQFRKILINNNKNLPVTLIYINGLINPSQVSEYVLKPLVEGHYLSNAKNLKEAIRIVEQGAVYFASQIKSKDINKVIQEILTGSTAIVFDKYNIAFIFSTKGFEKRAIIEPTSENVTKGAKDSFVETLETNIALVRQKIKSRNLIIEQTIVGRQTQTPVAIVYLKGLTNTHIVDETKKRLESISVDGVLASGYIEEFVTDNIYSVFPQVLSTERPDKFCASIVEGRVGIITDGLPITHIIPGTLVQFLQAPEDYSRNFIVGSIIRFMRYFLMIGSLLLPAFYIAITTFHQEMVPTEFAIAMAESELGIALPVFIEVLIMLGVFEALYEAGLRIPKNIGPTITIVGALVVGEAASNAKLVSSTVIVIVAISILSSFTMSDQEISNAIRLWRAIIAILSSITGLFGIVLGCVFLIHHLSKIETFGVPYLSPFVSTGENIMEDTLFRLPLKFHKTRPINLKPTNKKRRG